MPSDVQSKNNVVDELKGTVDFKAYPNPSANFIYIEVDDVDIVQEKLQVIDVQGRVINQLVVKDKITKLDLDKGIYFIRLNINGLWQSKKVIKY
jgi:hypothetical protein